MQAIRQTVKVKNHSFKITLPDNFNAEEVEVIIFAKQDDFVLSDEMKEILDSRVNEPTEDYLTSEESLSRLKKKYEI